MKPFLLPLTLLVLCGCGSKMNTYLVCYESMTENGGVVQGQCYLSAYIFGTNQVEYIKKSREALANGIGKNNIIIVSVIKMED